MPGSTSLERACASFFTDLLVLAVLKSCFFLGLRLKGLFTWFLGGQKPLFFMSFWGLMVYISIKLQGSIPANSS